MNNVTLVLKIFKFKFDHSKIDALLGLRPTEICKEGEEYYVGPPDKRTCQLVNLLTHQLINLSSEYALSIF
jgi:hypothetical protein